MKRGRTVAQGGHFRKSDVIDHAVSCTHELIEKLGRENHDFTMSVRFQVEQRLPVALVEFIAYSYCIPKKETTYFYGYRKQGVMPDDVIACCQGPFNGEEFLEGFKLFSREVDLFQRGEKFQVIMDENFAEAILPYFKELGWDHVAYPSVTYFMTKEQEELLMNSTTVEIPQGYQLGTSTLEDAELITSCYIWRKPKELEMTRMKLASFPTCCIRYNGSPIGFQMIHPSGMLNQLFVMKEHRGKGLGHIVEEALCRKLVKENWTIFKTVLCSNPSVLRGSDDSPYWTMKKKEDGSPKRKMYMDVWSRETLENKNQ